MPLILLFLSPYFSDVVPYFCWNGREVKRAVVFVNGLVQTLPFWLADSLRLVHVLSSSCLLSTANDKVSV